MNGWGRDTQDEEGGPGGNDPGDVDVFGFLLFGTILPS